ncbi:MAG: hypothetical protein KJ799_13210 [Bacteroidetes bacterium]|nr:hypothetical protein [Bacteroidota bacterium]MBU1681002.1 hypothetical protein [Bacteroidota bacterium]MBU2507664.1 hypothetical protein [Bacteroidota bacterium]
MINQNLYGISQADFSGLARHLSGGNLRIDSGDSAKVVFRNDSSVNILLLAARRFITIYFGCLNKTMPNKIANIE